MNLALQLYAVQYYVIQEGLSLVHVRCVSSFYPRLATAWAGNAIVCCLSVRLSGVTLMFADPTVWATSTFITRLISPVSRLLVRKTSAI